MRAEAITGGRPVEATDSHEHRSTCPICGKVFSWYSGYVYKLYYHSEAGKKGSYKHFCSWTCYRKAQASMAARKQAQREEFERKAKERERKRIAQRTERRRKEREAGK